jgi:Protein of unknown function (DUF3775)
MKKGSAMLLNINPALVCHIIEKIREFQAKEVVVIPEIAPDQLYESDWAQILADHQDDQTYQELELAIKDLEPDQQQALVALALIGRGDYSKDDWTQAMKDAQNLTPAAIVNFLLSIPLMPDYLTEGLDQLDISCD